MGGVRDFYNHFYGFGAVCNSQCEKYKSAFCLTAHRSAVPLQIRSSMPMKSPNLPGATLRKQRPLQQEGRTTARDLAEEGFRVIIPDQVGFGKSSKPAHDYFSFHQLAANTRNLLASLDIQQSSILGHSMGGMLATRYALMYPGHTTSLILVNPIGLEDWKRKVPYTSIDQWYTNELDKTYRSIRAYQLESYYDGKWKPEYNEWIDILTGMIRSPEYARFAWNQALTYEMIFTQPVCYEFELIEPVTLLIIGQRDRTALGTNLVSEEVRKTLGRYDELGRRTHDRIPDSKLVELDGIGHLPHIEAYDRFIGPLVEFLHESHR